MANIHQFEFGTDNVEMSGKQKLGKYINQYIMDL